MHGGFHVSSLRIFLQSLYVQYRHLFHKRACHSIEEIRRYWVFLNLQYICERNRSAIHDGIPFAEFSGMGWICQHCGAPFGDSAYRVKSEESGVVLLDIIVCQHCHLEARDLGLHTEEIGVRLSRQKPQQLKKKAGFASMNRKATAIEASKRQSLKRPRN
jgi:hypothetical protein